MPRVKDGGRRGARAGQREGEGVKSGGTRHCCLGGEILNFPRKREVVLVIWPMTSVVRHFRGGVG